MIQKFLIGFFVVFINISQAGAGIIECRIHTVSGVPFILLKAYKDERWLPYANDFKYQLSAVKSVIGYEPFTNAKRLEKAYQICVLESKKWEISECSEEDMHSVTGSIDYICAKNIITGKHSSYTPFIGNSYNRELNKIARKIIRAMDQL